LKSEIPNSLWVFVASVGLLTYATTRGPDGQLFIALVGFSIVGVTYWVTKLKKGNETVSTTFLTTFVELVFLEGAAVSAMLIDTRLDGMAGNLYLAIPLFIFVIAAIGLVVRTIRLWGNRSEQVAFRVYPDGRNN